MLRRFLGMPSWALFVTGMTVGMLLLTALLYMVPPHVRVDDPPIIFQPTIATDGRVSDGSLPERGFSERFRAVSASVRESVVFIEVSSPRRAMPNDWFHQFDGERPSERPLQQSVGSGVLLSTDGYVVTNNHVVEDAEFIRVTLSDKREYEARVVGLDPTTDLAVIQLQTEQSVPAIRLGDSDALHVGDWVVAIGNPFRLTSTVTAGIVSALGRQVDIIQDQLGIEDFIQTDAAINPGNSGGALVNLDGELVGIATAIATESGSYEGYGFAVPVNLVQRVVTDLIAFGEVRRGYLGVQITPVDAEVARLVGLSTIRGVYLAQVMPDGAASDAGLRTGDVVLSVDGRPVDEPNALQSAIARYRPGDRIALSVYRAGTSAVFEVALRGSADASMSAWLGEDPPDQTSEVAGLLEIPRWGLVVRPFNASEATGELLGADGAMIHRIIPASPVARAGVPREALITHIDDEPVSSTEEVTRILGVLENQGGAALLRVIRKDGRVLFYDVAIDDIAP